jgi:hypothetical protein
MLIEKKDSKIVTHNVLVHANKKKAQDRLIQRSHACQLKASWIDTNSSFVKETKKWPFGPMHNEKLRVQQKATSVIA